ncbi:MAG: hypothetical protein WC582_04125 [Patescibacteria group bacterium]
MKNIFKKILKFVSSRLVYLVAGIFLSVGATYVYATWDDAKTGGSGQLNQNNWNALVNEIHNKCGSNCDAKATAATASGNALTENNWNNLVDLTNNTLVDCTDNNGGKCFINQTLKSALDVDLVAGNIKTGASIFGVNGTLVPSVAPVDCTGSIDIGEGCGGGIFVGNNLVVSAGVKDAAAFSSSLCSGTYNGFSNWRLPTLAELSTGVLHSSYSHWLNSNYEVLLQSSQYNGPFEGSMVCNPITGECGTLPFQCAMLPCLERYRCVREISN